jgi:hypothetical protein
MNNEKTLDLDAFPHFIGKNLCKLAPAFSVSSPSRPILVPGFLEKC